MLRELTKREDPVLGEKLVPVEDGRRRTGQVHHLSVEVSGERAAPIGVIRDCFVAVPERD